MFGFVNTLLLVYESAYPDCLQNGVKLCLGCMYPTPTRLPHGVPGALLLVGLLLFSARGVVVVSPTPGI